MTLADGSVVEGGSDAGDAMADAGDGAAALPSCDDCECTENLDCSDAAASKCLSNNTCSACETNEDCGHIPGKGVCAEGGVCVQCDATNYGACDGMVCDTRPGATQFTCSPDAEPGDSESCQECVSDAHCLTGTRCISTSFDGQDTGYFCLLKEGNQPDDGTTDCETAAGYFVAPLETSSLDGEEGFYCSLRSTTCLALAQFNSKACSADTDCGEPGLDDGYCRTFGNGMECTYPCISDKDCSSTTCSLTPPRACNF